MQLAAQESQAVSLSAIACAMWQYATGGHLLLPVKLHIMQKHIAARIIGLKKRFCLTFRASTLFKCRLYTIIQSILINPQCLNYKKKSSKIPWGSLEVLVQSAFFVSPVTICCRMIFFAGLKLCMISCSTLASIKLLQLCLLKNRPSWAFVNNQQPLD